MKLEVQGDWIGAAAWDDNKQEGSVVGLTKLETNLGNVPVASIVEMDDGRIFSLVGLKSVEDIVSAEWELLA